MITIYHNTRCKKSRAGLEYLTSKTNDFEIVEYLKTGISVGKLQEILRLMNKNPEDILRKQEEYYKKNIKGNDLTDSELLKEMSENPRLIERPLLVKDDIAVLAQPPEEIDKLF
ncbi:MAG: arsenate reductase [Marinilabiliales bacterium]|nr:MAG: arsenate reductase [Marinilabiliales bacterium]